MRRTPHWPRVLFLLAAMVSPAFAQPCPSGGDTFWKRDTLPQNPAGLTAVSVIQGLCEGEAAGVVFNIPPGVAPQKLTQVVAPWGAQGGVGGHVATVNVEIYDGITWSGNIPNMGNLVFDLSTTGANLQVMSHGLNTFDVSSYNIVVGNGASTSFVVAFRSTFNPSGNCTTGYPANFFTDNGSGGLFCNPAITPSMTSLIDIQGQGWRDGATATVSGIPLCPFYFAGIWAIRCCTTNAPPLNPFQITATGSPAPPGGFINLTLNAPGMNGLPYVMAASSASSPGIPTAFGTVPLFPDALFQFSLDPVATAGIFVNFQGTIGLGTAPALILVPNVPALSGFTFVLAYVIPFPGGLAISDPRTVGVL